MVADNFECEQTTHWDHYGSGIQLVEETKTDFPSTFDNMLVFLLVRLAILQFNAEARI